MSETEFTDMILSAVLTVREVCALWGVGQSSVMMAIYKDKLQARQAKPGAIWLVTRSSATRLYGQPKGEEWNEELVKPRSQ